MTLLAQIASPRAHGKPRRLAGLIAALTLIAAPAAAPAAEDKLVTGSDVDAILAVAEGFGSARRDVDNVGDPMISGRMGGQEYRVFFFDCIENKNCRTIQFWSYISGTGVSLDKVHEWNRDKRFAKAYFDADGDVVMEWDVNLWGGVSKTNLDDTFDWWKVVMPEFIEFMQE